MTKHLTESEAWSTELPRTGVEFHVLTGTVWVTQESDPEDHILVGPATFTSDRRGRLAVMGLTAADVQFEGAARRPFQHAA